MIWILLILFGVALFSFSSGNLLYKSKFKRSKFEKNLFIKNEKHANDEKIMDLLKEKKLDWLKKREARKIEIVKIRGYGKSTHTPLLYGEVWLPENQELSNNLVVLLVHGFTDSSSGMAYLAEEYHQKNCIVISINLRAHGSSTGEYSGLGYLDAKDLNLWIDYAIKRFGENAKLLVHGVSMGGSTVVQALFSQNVWENNTCKLIGAVADCGFACFKKQTLLQIQKVFGTSKLQRIIGTIIYGGISCACFVHGGFFIAQSSSINAIKRFNCKKMDEKYVKSMKKPFLIIFHGEDDSLVYPENADIIYCAAQKKGITKNIFVKVKNAPHIGSYFYEPKKYMDTIINEIKKE